MNIKKELNKMILSPSGWRKIFAADGNEENKTTCISEEDKVLCTAMALSLVHVLHLGEKSCITAGMDARPTGPEMARYMTGTFKHFGIQVVFLGITAAPEIMAYSEMEKSDCFAYITASHNPIGHNGTKFGTNGGVFNSEKIIPIIEDFKKTALSEEALKIKEQLDSLPLMECSEKERALKDYRKFVLATVRGQRTEQQFIDSVKNGPAIGIIGELNGSARSVSIDKSLFNELGIKTVFLNDIPGQVVHPIVPEGENLELCRATLQKEHDRDSSFILGYVPDNDGDRGNLVYINSKGKAEILKAQEVFALVVYAILIVTKTEKKIAVAVNGSTSCLIDETTSFLNVKTFHAEVGEANVVQLGEKLRKQGYEVPVLGEGSNGGNITYPSKVRDPLNTVLALVNILSKGYEINDLLADLPSYTTTDAFSPEAKLYLKTTDYTGLKEIYEKNFPEEWENHKAELARHNIVSFKELQTNGIVEREEKGNGGKGGLKICFLDDENCPNGFIWMRPSGTEPLFRILADCKGKDKKFHDFLLNWQKVMILNAQETLLKS